MREYTVEKAVVGDVTVDDSGYALRKSVLYASGKRREGNGTFWAVRKGSLNAWDKQKPGKKMKMALALTTKMHNQNGVGKAKGSQTAEDSGCSGHAGDEDSTQPCDEQLDKSIGGDAKEGGEPVEQWLRENEGVVRDLGGPGARRHVAELMRFHVHEYGDVLWGADEDGMCACAALVRAVDAVRGHSVATCYREKLRKLRPSIDSLSGMAELLREMIAQVHERYYARVELRRLKKEELQAFSSDSAIHTGKAPYECLNQKRRWFVVRFEVPGKLDHVVFVDGRRSLVWDNEEGYPVALNPDSLCLCSGLKSKDVVVSAMEMVTQRGKKNQEKTEVVALD